MKQTLIIGNLLRNMVNKAVGVVQATKAWLNTNSGEIRISIDERLQLKNNIYKSYIISNCDTS